MQVVIDIPKEMYEEIIDESGIDTMVIPFRDIIRNGTPLPKGHGDLKDVGECNRKMFYQQCGSDSLITVETAFDMLLSLPTIIKADKESGDK